VDPITITGLTAGQVHNWLARVLPHLGTDDTLPFLMRVQITIGDGYVLAAATDRYTLAVTHLPATTGAARARFTIDGEWARETAAELNDRRIADVPAELSLTADRFGIDLHGYHDEEREPYFDGEWNATATEPEFIKWEAMARLPLASPADPTPVPVRADLLGRFTVPGTLILDPAAPSILTAVSPGPGLPPLSVHSPGGGKPLVLLGPGFLGLLAVIKTHPDRPAPTAPAIDPDGWHAAWAEVLGAERTAVPA
jgi:hypothetical protein